jgi:hypothetical protein
MHSSYRSSSLTVQLLERIKLTCPNLRCISKYTQVLDMHALSCDAHIIQALLLTVQLLKRIKLTCPNLRCRTKIHSSACTPINVSDAAVVLGNARSRRWTMCTKLCSNAPRTGYNMPMLFHIGIGNPLTWAHLLYMCNGVARM